MEVPVLGQAAKAQRALDAGVLRAVFDSLHDAVIVGIYPERRILDVNPAFERMFGYTVDEVRGQTAEMLYGESARFREVGAAMSVPVYAGESVRFECVFRRKDGQSFLAEVTTCPLRPAGEGDIGIVSIVRDVSKSRASEAALRESEARLQLVSEATLDVPWDWDLRTGAFWCSRSLQSVFGYGPDDVLTGIDGWNARIHPDDRARVVRDIQHIIAAGGAHWADEHRFRRADGTYAHVLARGKVIRDASGSATRMVGAVTDITERRLEQERARRRELRIHAQQEALLALAHAPGPADRTLRGTLRMITETAARTLELARVSIWLCDERCTTLRCLDGFERRAGIHHEGAVLALPPESVYWDALRGGRTVSARDAVSDPRTSLLAESYLIPYNVSSLIDAPIRSGGRLVGVVCHEHEGPMRAWEPDEEIFAASIADLVALAIEEDERARAERALRESEAQMAAILDNMPVAVYTRGLDGRVRFVNDLCARSLRLGKADIVGRLESDLLPPEVAVLSAEGDALALETGIHTSEEKAFFFGRERTLLVTKFVLRDHDDEPYALGGVIADVTERKLEEQELVAARRQVAHSEKLSALGSLVSGVAHEIRTPLTYLNNHLFVLNARLAKAIEALPPGEARAMLAATQLNLRSAEEGADRIKHLVEDLRRFMRLKSGEREDVDLAEVVQDALDLFRAAHRGRVSIEARLEPTPRLTLDKVQLQQVVINLLENAVDASPSGATIVIATRSAEGGAELTVQDPGVGIPPEVQARMFDAFYTTKPEGTGLGLSIVRRIVETHDGFIACHSRPGEGTRFVVTFPAPDARTSPPQPS